MASRSPTIASLDKEGRVALEKRLLDRQSGKCFICDDAIDLVLHQGQLEIDHIIPLHEDGPDEENNFALVHASCNESKGASDLRVARRMAEFDRLQREAQHRGERGANLGHVLQRYGGGKSRLRLKLGDGQVEYVLSDTGSSAIRTAPVYRDPLSGMDYFFAVLPLAYLHHDDRINPRSIGPNIRSLIEEFLKKRPQLHVGLTWWTADAEGLGTVKMFDGQHKAAAQILIGVKELPVRVFVNPDTNVLLQANTNAGDKLRQIAFDTAVLRHLGSTLYAERVRQYQRMKGLREDDYSFSEKDLVAFFRGEHRAIQRYILDLLRDSVTHNKENRLMEFVEWSGKGADRPLAYNTIERTFFSEFLYKQMLDTPIDDGMERGDNSRVLERDQLVKLMSTFANVFFVGQWDPDIGGRQLESRLQHGDPIPEGHLRAWRVAREEVLANILEWVRLVIENYFVWTAQVVDKDRILQQRFTDSLWRRIEIFLRHFADLPCWIDKNLSLTVFGTKQNRDFWKAVFKKGIAPNEVRVLAQPLDLNRMIRETPSMQGVLSA